MEQTFIRQGSNLELLEKEVRNEDKTNTLCIWGIQKFFDPKQCFRFFCKHFGDHPNLTHICKIKSKPFFLVKFSEDINIEEFNTKFAKNKRVKAKHALENMALEQLNFITIEECSRPAQKKQVFATEQDWQKVKSTKIQDIVEPLHRLPYEEQVESKIKDINRVIENYNRAFFKDSEVLRLQKNKIQIKPLKLDEFIKCQGQREGYRSKSEFTIGYNLDGEVVVGFNKGSYHNLTITIETPRNVKIISKNTKLIAAVVQNFIRQHLDVLQPYDRVKQIGFWRYLIVRESQRTKQSMVVVVCKTQDCDLKLLGQIKQDFMVCMKKSIIGLTSLGFLSYNGQADSVPTQKPQLLLGRTFYQQRILDHLFQVSSSAFLQIHIEMCEVLYSQIIKQVSDCDVVLDLGCGIGTIGISIQNKLPHLKVIGIEICQQAVEDARKNSENYDVHLGRAEELIKQICDKYRGNRIVAILDPPRAGFNKEVIQALRRCRGLDNLIYVACNAGAIQDNLLQLCLPPTERRRAPEFQIQSMKGFDLFPQTNHYEALYVMKRIQ